eukprot:CAMPEP_0175254970 /NCGR_PEP_ID=MMETSP0093-20121207/37460_1 /TAXON_ID=311494 /ORGANISM="Alexandrium monilatum, Strain CCMP3105" /LENGTH=299 /DNA_ID=CAMNT_0016549297 /DNA_START=49 /DNA_END=948 /DNA_ORIENTATION=+
MSRLMGQTLLARCRTGLTPAALPAGFGGFPCTQQRLRSLATEAAQRQTRQVEINGRPLHVITGGDASSGTPVICLPGAMGTGETDFGYQLDGLSHRHGVVSFDPRGYGQSRPPNRRYPADFYHLDADDAAKIMDVLGCRSYHVIGWSDGAISATILASKRPEAVKKLVVFGIQAYITKEDVETYEGMRDVEQAWSARMLATHKAVYGDDVQPMWSSFCDAMKMIYDAGGDFCQKEAKSLQCPTLVLHGEKDPIVPTHHPQWFHDNIPGSKMHVFPGGKHNIHQKFAEEFNRRVLDFFSE